MDPSPVKPCNDYRTNQYLDSRLGRDPESEDLVKACWDSKWTKCDIKIVGSVTTLSFGINFCAAVDNYINLTAYRLPS